jgi:Spy/CpxP family protein refolding chaperone
MMRTVAADLGNKKQRMTNNMKNKITIALAILALGASALVASAQDNNNDGPPPDSQSATNHMGGRGGPRGFHLLPPRAEQQLQLTDDQKKQIAALQTETQTKLEKILTPEQMKQLENMRPPMRRGGPGGRGNNGGENNNNMPPGNDGGGNNPPPGPPPADN